MDTRLAMLNLLLCLGLVRAPEGGLFDAEHRESVFVPAKAGTTGATWLPGRHDVSPGALSIRWGIHVR